MARRHPIGGVASQAERLAPEDIEAIATRVVELLGGSPTTGLIDAAEVARRCGVSRAWVYDHAGQLGAVRLGSGSRPRLRFNADRAVSAIAALTRVEEPPAVQPRRRPRPDLAASTAAGSPLLPIARQTDRRVA